MRLSLVSPAYATPERILGDLTLNEQSPVQKYSRHAHACLQRVNRRGLKSNWAPRRPRPSRPADCSTDTCLKRRIGRVEPQATQDRSQREQAPDGEHIVKAGIDEIEDGTSSDQQPSSPSHPLPPGGRVSLHNSAFNETWWEHCTVRGWADGSTVYKFNQLDPGKSGSLLPLEGMTWTTALKLGVKFKHHYNLSINKLQKYISEWDPMTGISAKYELKRSQFKTWTKAARQAGLLQPITKEPLPSSTSSSDLIESASSSGGEEEQCVSKEEHVVENDSDLVRDDLLVVITESTTRVEDCLAKPADSEKLDQSNEAKPVESIGTDSEESKSCTEMSSPSAVNEDDCDFQRSFESPEKLPAPPNQSLKDTVTWLLASWARWMRCILAASFTACIATILKLYRKLPYFLRNIFHTTWPPTVDACHESEKVARLLEKKDQMSKVTLAEAGFDSQGRYINANDVLNDVPVWRLEQLVRSGIRNPSLYREALTHVTAITPGSRLKSFERLEFLGDAVMELCIRETLMQHNPESDEGELTMQGQALVSGTSVNNYALWLGLDCWVVRNIYAMRDGMAASPNVFGDAFEALLGAVYLDKGLGAARSLLMKVLDQCPSVEWVQPGESVDFKGQLWRLRHVSKQSPPVYLVNSDKSRVYGRSGYRRKYWIVEVLLDGEIKGKGGGFEKKEAEQRAAQAALQAIS